MRPLQAIAFITCDHVVCKMRLYFSTRLTCQYFYCFYITIITEASVKLVCSANRIIYNKV